MRVRQAIKEYASPVRVGGGRPQARRLCAPMRARDWALLAAMAGFVAGFVWLVIAGP